jgi:cephalosporin hydroxylase/glycosyltransferase involved in cell wall biosynthesis
MFPFWDTAIEPILRASNAKRVLEIGAFRGETTVLLVDLLGADTELHVVDPLPQFDPGEHERRFRGRYVFHRDTSHNVLPHLPPVDVALIDGDHNWYTVYHELKMLESTAHEAGRPLPALVMHDVCWPYGRRDLYYEPEQIPEEYRHPYHRRGMMPRRKRLLDKPGFGINSDLANAEHEGGPRNGVMTALDDFVAEHPQRLRRVVIPVYFGLAVVAEEQRLANEPALAAAFDRLESAKGRLELLELAERVRIDDVAFERNVAQSMARKQTARAARRYLGLLKSALLDEHYLENEVRLDYLVRCATAGEPPDPATLRDPERELRQETRLLRANRRAGSRIGSDGNLSAFLPFAPMGRIRLEHLESLLDTIRIDEVAGDFVECGAGRGGGGIFMRAYLAAHEMPDTRVWVADGFLASSAAPSAAPEKGGHAGGAIGDLRADLNLVRDAFARFDLFDERVRFLQGAVGDTLLDAPIHRIALLRVDASSDGAAADALELLYDRVVEGGYVVVDGIDADAELAVKEFRARRSIEEPIERVDAVARCWRKTTPAASVSVQESKPAGGALRAPLIPPAPRQAVDLSVVLVLYNMRREAKRTLHSLSRAYQQGVDELRYEVIVVENGSDEARRVGHDAVRSFGDNFHYLDLGDEATASPANALNRGVGRATGEVVAFMIDGAHIVTPGVLRYAMLGLETYRPAIVAVQQWFVGPGQQGEAMLRGYDHSYEDQLFAEIEWPVDGYRLFEIGHFVGGRDWFDGLFESNCFFVPRGLLEQVGAVDESFSMPGGGYANLDFYERIGSSPGVNIVKILGEASFHQLHGGTTTNEPDAVTRGERLIAYRRHYQEMRGRGFRGPRKPIYYIGSMTPAAKRTRARRLVAPVFRRVSKGGPDGRPEHAEPITEDLKTAFVDAFYRSLAWREWRWLGKQVRRCPTDMIVYQELVAETRPDWIIETATGGGGRALFLASICDLIGHGQVLSIDDRAAPKLPEHARVTFLREDPFSPDTIEHVRQIVGGEGNGMLVLGLHSRRRILQAFDAYSPYVAVGSYAVVEDTIVNGNPVWANFGPGPSEAVRTILQTHDNFAANPAMEKLALTFNPGGFLKRIG